MRILKNKTLRFISKLIALFFGILSFSSCYGVMLVEYGAPYAEYKISGKVSSSVTNAAISGITVEYLPEVSTQSQADGSYSLLVREGEFKDELIIKFKDTDGAANGQFSDKDVTVDFSAEEFSDGNNKGYMGSKSKVVDTKLDPQ